MDELQKPQLRARQYFFVDGTFEFSFGLLSLILAAFFYLGGRLQGCLAALLDASLVLVIIAGAWLVQRLIAWLKQNVTYPRTGYVAYPPKQGLRRGLRIALGLGIGASTALFATILAAGTNHRIDAMTILSGALLGAAMAVVAWRSRLPRFYVLAGVSAAAGLALGLGRPGGGGLAAYYLVLALVLLVSGGLTLGAYLHSSPAQP